MSCSLGTPGRWACCVTTLVHIRASLVPCYLSKGSGQSDPRVGATVGSPCRTPASQGIIGSWPAIAIPLKMARPGPRDARSLAHRTEGVSNAALQQPRRPPVGWGAAAGHRGDLSPSATWPHLCGLGLFPDGPAATHGRRCTQHNQSRG